MGWRLAGPEERPSTGFVKRFDARFWTVNFPRPMMAAVTTPAADALQVDAVFYGAGDLAGLIWECADARDHPLLRYDSDRDLRGCVLSFRWVSTGCRPLDAINGPTLTIEGRDAAGTPRAWYVRLWNYADGSPEDAQVTLDFDRLEGGFLLPGEADPVWAGDVDRLSVSLVAPGYDGSADPLPAPAEARVTLSGLRCDGPRSVLAIGNALVPPHALRIATGYDDLYNLTPARVVRNLVQLGYRGPVDHYVGMSHYFRLAGGLATLDGGALNAPCAAWHRAFLAEAAAHGLAPILSLSYELLDQHCPEPWKQRAPDGQPALTGWVPPSTLLSPAVPAAIAYLQAVAQAFVALALEAGLPVRFQLGEPWWWVTAHGALCLYDGAAAAALDAGSAAPVSDMRGVLDAAQVALLDRAGGCSPPPPRRWRRRCARRRRLPSCCCSSTCRLCSIRARPSSSGRTCRPAGPARRSTCSSSRITTGRPPATAVRPRPASPPLPRGWATPLGRPTISAASSLIPAMRRLGPRSPPRPTQRGRGAMPRPSSGPCRRCCATG